MQVTVAVSAPNKPEREVKLSKDVIIGRAKSANLRIVSTEVSREHCRLVISDDRIAVRDLGSANGTQVDGKTIDSNVDVLLASGSQLEVGPLKLVLRFNEADLPESFREQLAAQVAAAAAQQVEELDEPIYEGLEDATEITVPEPTIDPDDMPETVMIPEPSPLVSEEPVELETADSADDQTALIDGEETALEPAIGSQSPSDVADVTSFPDAQSSQDARSSEVAANSGSSQSPPDSTGQTSTEKPVKKRGLFGLFGKKKKTDEAEDSRLQEQSTVEEIPAAAGIPGAKGNISPEEIPTAVEELPSGSAAVEPVSDSNSAEHLIAALDGADTGDVEESLVPEQADAESVEVETPIPPRIFSSGDDEEELPEEEEEVPDEFDEDEFEDDSEDVDPGFADFLNGIGD